jgi:ABC-type multidrug transport system fused ATPase/permease subunit
MTHLPDADPGVPDDRSATRYLGWLVRRYRLPVLGALVMGVVWMLFQAFVPAVVGKAIDAATRHDRDGLMLWCLVLFLIGA